MLVHTLKAGPPSAAKNSASPNLNLEESHMTCREAMTANPACCLPQDNVARAAQLMKSEDVGPVPVVSSHEDRTLVGIVTDRDLTLKVLAEGRDVHGTTVSDVMSTILVTCHPEDDLEDAMQAMQDNQVRRIVVVERDGRLAGIIAQADLARYADQEDVGETVEEISEPASGWSGVAHEKRWRDNSAASAALVTFGGLALGAGLMYMLDPDVGRRRRALVRDKAMKYSNRTGRFVGKVGRDMSNRARGLRHEASRLTHGEMPDSVPGAHLTRSNWSPATRVLAGALGGGLLFWGLRTPGKLNKAAASLGAGLLTRGITNREVSKWMPGGRMMSMVGL
jgi:CBS domain-containing protein